VIRRGPARRGKPLLAALGVLLPALLFPVRGSGTEEYAVQTGKPCIACHLNPAGGGDLTAEGVAFRKEMRSAGGSAQRGGGLRMVRFFAGLVHLVTGVLWFGTILYVHLLLKPAYAAKGLPRGELLVGWISIVLMAVTGAILTAFRISSLEAFFHTRFGVLLTAKIAIFLVMVTTAVLVTFVIGPRLKRRQQTIDQRKKDMAADDISQFDGKEGRPAYFAYQGRIYDATGSGLWKKGNHVGKHQAGFDLSDALKLAPHGEEKIASLPFVGRLLETGEASKKPFHVRGFYFMAYLNLGLVFCVLLIISLWRWW
jgi:predicted heme/steroid binding protein